MRVLITSTQVEGRSGAELYVRDLALELMRRRILPVVYSPRIGPVGEALRQASVPVTDSLDSLAEPPDVIHGNHSLETMAAVLHFTSTPALFTCHDCSAWHDRPPCFPRIRRYVAVDDACRERLTMQHGVSLDKVAVIFNGVDLKRFPQRLPLPSQPRRALLISNYADERTVRKLAGALSKRGATLEAVGAKFGGACETPEERLQDYDLVFAKGRCAWEALAVGAAVVVCDQQGHGPMVTSQNLAELRRLNFGRRLLESPLRSESLLEQIDRYDADDARETSRRVRESAGLVLMVDQLTDLYAEIIDEHRRGPTEPADELRAAAEIVQWWAATRRELIREKSRRNHLPAHIARGLRSLRKRFAAAFA